MINIATVIYLLTLHWVMDLSVSYMIDATGVGCGVVWLEERLFSTREEAEQSCGIKEGDKKDEFYIS